MLFSVLILFSVVLFLVYWLSGRNYWKQRNVVQTDDILWKFMFGDNSMPEICKNTYYDQHDDKAIGTFMGGQPALIMKDLDDIQAVIASDFQSFHSRGINTNECDLLADSILFINDVSRWKLIRQKISPVFTSAKLKNMFYILNKTARDFVEALEDNPHLRKEPFSAVYTYTTSAIGGSIFGINTQSRNSMDSPFLSMAKKAAKPTFKFNLNVLISNVSPKLFKMLGMKFFGDHEEFFIGVVKKVLENRRCDPEPRHDFIEICMELQKQGVMHDFSSGLELNPSDELLAAQAFFFFVAGTDTTANAIHFTLLEIAGHKNVLEKLHEEIDEIFKESTGELTYKDLEKMTYLDKVINEVLRMYPPIGLNQRICTKDTVLPSSKVKVEKNTIMILPIFAIHRDKTYFPNPNQFDPERFSPENVAQVPKYAYMPFGEGNRVCIGARFARLQMKAAIAWLLRKFTLEEKIYKPDRFEKGPFSLRDPEAKYTLIKRNLV